MRLALAGHAGGRERVGVGAHQHPRGAADLVDVLLAHRRDQDARRPAVGDQEVADGVQRIDASAPRDLAERAARVLGLVRRDGDTHDVPRRDAPEVGEAFARQVRADPRARLGPAEPLETEVAGKPAI